MNNSTTVTSPICYLLSTESAKAALSSFATFALFWFKPIALVLDLFGHILCFVAFFKKSRKNSLYSFQFYEVVSKCLDTFGAFFNLLFYQWFAGVATDGAAWFRSDYILMYIAAKFGIMVYDMTTSIKLFVTLAMTVDRFFALAEPVEYRKLNRLKWEGSTMAIAVFVGIAINVYEFFYSSVSQVEKSDLLKIVQNNAYISSPLNQAFVFIRFGIYILALIFLVGCGAKVIILFQQRNKKVATMVAGSNEMSKEKARKANEHSLFVLTIFKSAQIMNEFLIKILHTSLSTFKPGFGTCEGGLFISIRHVEVSFINTLDFYVMILMSRTFRETVRQALPGASSRVVTAGNQGMAQTAAGAVQGGQIRATAGHL